MHCPAGVQGHRVHQSWLHLRGDACSLFHGCSHVPRPPGDVTQVSRCSLQFVYRPHQLVGLIVRVSDLCISAAHSQHIEDCFTEDSAEVEDVLLVVWSGLNWKDSQDDLVSNCIFYG